MSVDKSLLSLLKFTLWGDEIRISDGFKEWLDVFSLAKSQSVLGLVANAALNDAEVARMIPANAQKRLKAFVMLNMTTHSLLNNTLVRVVSLLDDAGVKSVLLKGQGLARNYPMPELRQCGDIDLYVGESNYIRVHELLAPVATEIDDVSCLAVGKHFHVSIGKVLIEVHRFADVLSSPIFNGVYQEYAAVGLSEGLVALDFGGVKVNTPSDDFNAFYVFNHLWHHFMNEGVGLRQVCDWMMFLHSRYGHLDHEYLRQLLERMDLIRPWKTFGCVLVNKLGMPSEEFPFYDSTYSRVSDMVLARILADGNFGSKTAFARKKVHGYFYEKWLSLKCHVQRVFSLMRMFPRHALRRFLDIISTGVTVVWRDMVK